MQGSVYVYMTIQAHLKGLQSTLTGMLDSGLERFIPEKTWPVGKPLEAEMLVPAKALDRPTLVLVTWTRVLLRLHSQG